MLDFSHRKDIVKRRILALGNLFSVGIYAYAVMSNHVHVVLTVQPDQANQWSTDEVVERWLGIRSGYSLWTPTDGWVFALDTVVVKLLVANLWYSLWTPTHQWNFSYSPNAK